ncbi:hypothetical protein [Nisaea sp.]|uniref:hypothetical protein n=1 Tax=Nisaea sp. TaxID=2024842 RepID=UPI003B526453
MTDPVLAIGSDGRAGSYLAETRLNQGREAFALSNPFGATGQLKAMPLLTEQDLRLRTVRHSVSVSGAESGVAVYELILNGTAEVAPSREPDIW